MPKRLGKEKRPVSRPDSAGQPDWPKRTRDVDAKGKPVARCTSKLRKQEGI